MTIIQSISDIVDGSGVYHWEQHFDPPSTVVHNFDEQVDIAPTDLLQDVDVGILDSQSKLRTEWPEKKYQSKWRYVRKNKIIKMTELGHYSEFEHKMVVKLPKLRAAWKFPTIAEAPGYSIVGDPAWMLTTWNENVTDDTLQFIGQAYSDSNSDEVEDSINLAIAETKGNVVADSYQTWDALTSRAELPKTLELLAGVLKTVARPLQSFRALAKRAERNPKHISDLWLQYRYGIMPLIYDVKNYLDLITSVGYAYKTSRSSRQGVWSSPFVAPDEQCTYYNTVHDWRVSSTAKARFTSSSLKAFDQVSFNPALTAWELVPYSFVVDWFVNVGTFIKGQTLSLVDAAVERKMCYAIKRSMRRKKYFRRRWDSGYISPQIYEGREYHIPVPVDDRNDYLLIDEGYDTYERRIFRPNDVRLTWNPSLSWQRFLDGLALSMGSSIKTLRKLRL